MHSFGLSNVDYSYQNENQPPNASGIGYQALLRGGRPENSRVRNVWAGTPIEYKARIPGFAPQRPKRHEIWIDEEFADKEPATILKYSPEFPEGRNCIWNFSKYTDQVCSIKGSIAIRKLLSVSLCQHDIGEASSCRAPCQINKHLLLYIEDIKNSVRQ